MKILHLAGRDIETDRAAFVMGIVNCTPDSFWKESRGGEERALLAAEEGADILDIGGESTRPGAKYVDAQEEIKRIIPIIKAVRKRSSIPISVDTRKSEVLKAALDEGADILNDVSALEDGEGISDLAAKSGIAVILMHKRGNPAIMQKETKYKDVFGEVSGYLAERAKRAQEKGIAREKIIVDPGVGFGKDKEGNIELIKRCGLLCGGEYPVLIGLSRKSCIGEITGRDEAGRLWGSIAGISFAAFFGASIVRVHDVKESVDAVKVAAALGDKA